MSQDSLLFSINRSYGSNDRLLVYYDFSGLNQGDRDVGSIGIGGGYFDALIENCDPASNTGIFSGQVLDSSSLSIAGAKQFATGQFILDNQAKLFKSNIKVTTQPNTLNYSDASVLFDFEFAEDVSDCVLFGSLEKTSETVNEEVITGAKGYNFGITARGKPFYQGFDKKGDFIYTADSIELSKRNILGFSVGTNTLSITRVDLLNSVVDTEDFHLDTSFIGNNTEFFIGGSEQYFRGSPMDGSFKTSTAKVNSFCLFSGVLPPSVMHSMASGMVGDYFGGSSTPVFEKRLTGYNQTITYKTGITGYDYDVTGSINISTGRYMLTGSYFGASSVNTGEGDRFFEYSSFEESGVRTFYKREIGFLKSDSGYQYLPTGEGAFDTLGLQNVDGAVSEYIEQQGISGAQTTIVQLFGSRMQTGLLSGISGILQEPVYEQVVASTNIIDSGINMGASGELFKKDFIFWLGERV